MEGNLAPGEQKDSLDGWKEPYINLKQIQAVSSPGVSSHTMNDLEVGPIK